MLNQQKFSSSRFWQYAIWLALFTIVYNLAEGLVSIHFGIQDETLTLFGFGVDSFIEVASGLGILALVLRIRANPDSIRSQFLRQPRTPPILLFASCRPNWLLTLSITLSVGISPKRPCLV